MGANVIYTTKHFLGEKNVFLIDINYILIYNIIMHAARVFHLYGKYGQPGIKYSCGLPWLHG